MLRCMVDRTMKPAALTSFSTSDPQERLNLEWHTPEAGSTVVTHD